MANGFAGTNQSADRRRRRLSHDLNGEDEFPLSLDAESDQGLIASSVWTSEFDTQLLRKVVSPELWKHFTAIAILVSLTAYAVYQMNTVAQIKFMLSVSRIAACFLLLAGQLALLIGWIRAESDFDYKGRYRWWTSLSIVLLISAGLRLTDSSAWAANGVIALVQLATGPLYAARPAVLLVPLVVISVLITFRIILDMQRCFESQLVMVVSVVALIVMTVWQHIGLADSSKAIIASFDISVAVLMFSSLLLHARYVAYVNHDPPVLIQSSVTEAVRESVELIDAPATKSPVVANAIKEDPEVAAEVQEQPVVAEKKTSRPKKRRKTRRAA